MRREGLQRFVAGRAHELFVLVGIILSTMGVRSGAQDRPTDPYIGSPAVRAAERMWKDSEGFPFARGTIEFGIFGGVGIGQKILLSETAHDLALGSVNVGWTFSDLVARDHWYRGTWELLGEAFGGGQFHPDGAYLGGGDLLIRYNLATRTRWVPFINVGAGASATSIRDDDLSTTFEYTLQAGVGIHYFVGKNTAITCQYRFIHLSNAGLAVPNLGVNTSMFYLGASWFFGPGHR